MQNTMKQTVVVAAVALCWMFSPDGLVLLGNIAGRGGWLFSLTLGVALLLSIWALWLLYPLAQNDSEHPESSPVTPGGTTTGNLASNLAKLSLNLACCLSLVVLLPTGALVTAGYTFNETFVYWFPNFGFSFLLLGFILLLHLSNEQLPRLFQVIFIGTTLCCLALITLFGLLSAPEIPQQVSTGITLQTGADLSTLSLLLLLGFDQNLKNQGAPVSTFSKNRRIVLLCLATLIVVLWGIVSLRYVPQQKLGSSTIPYILTAREIMGQPGRLLIGIAIISGSCGLLNGLLLFTRDSISSTLAPLAKLPNMFTLWFQRLYALGICLAIGFAMASGLAGDEILETYIFGALILWLLHTGVRSFTAPGRIRHQQKAGMAGRILLALLMMAAFCFLALSYSDGETLLKFLAATLGCSTVVAALLILPGRFQQNKS